MDSAKSTHPTGFHISDELRTLVRGGNCNVFIGSGLSVEVYLTWHKVVRLLCEACGLSEEIDSNTPTPHLLKAADRAKQHDADAYYNFLGKHFGQPAVSAQLTYDALLKIPFKSILTVNLDPLLALKLREPEGHAQRPWYTYPDLDRNRVREGTVHYLHGIVCEGQIPKPGSIVFAESEFDEAYADNGPLMSFLSQTLQYDPILFIGCRLLEPPMKRVFEACEKHHHQRAKLCSSMGEPELRPPQRYILLPGKLAFSSEDERIKYEIEAEAEEHFYSERHIEIVRYPADHNHSALRIELEQLAGLPSMRQRYGNGGTFDAR